MTVKEVIITAAGLLELEEKVTAFIGGNADVGAEETAALVRCFNLVENEVALDYFPLIAEETIKTDTGRVAYKDLGKAAVRILGVKTEVGNAIDYKLYPEYLSAQPGILVIGYTYTPEKKTLEGTSDFQLVVSERLLAYGVAAEYCFATGYYEEGEAWNKKYKAALAAAYRSTPAKSLRSRRWV